ncbi:MAG: glycosyltransferase family A protein [Pseudomonadota bacterium]
MEQKKPTLSIIIPAYNVEKYIVAALDSVLGQTILPEEMIIINDGSTDRTSDLLKKYTDYPNFHIITIHNNGAGPARNLGRMLANHEYIYFFDSDDMLRNTFVADIKNMISTSNHPDLILFGSKNFSDEKNYYKFLSENKHKSAGLFKKNDRLLTKLSKNKELFSSPCLYVSKKAIWAKNRIHFPPVVHEDEVVIASLIAISQSTLVTSKVFFLRRVRPGSIMTSGICSDNAEGILRLLNYTQEFMHHNRTLIRPDLATWRFRLGMFAIHYFKLCKVSDTRIAWRQLFSALLASRSIICFVLFPITVLRSIRKNIVVGMKW